MKQLKAAICWLIWKRTAEGTKLPLYPDGRYGLRWKDSGNLISFNHALICRRNTGADGIGLILPENYYCLDIDEAGPEDPRVKALIEDLDSYTELSPSGAGIHIPIYASNIKGARNITFKTDSGLTIELKARSFVTYTGKVLLDRPIKDHSELVNRTYAGLEMLHVASLRANRAVPRESADAMAGMGDVLVGVKDKYTYAEGALRRELETIKRATKGGRRKAIFTAGVHLSKYIKAGVLNEGTVRRELARAGAFHGLPERSVQDQIRNALTS